MIDENGDMQEARRKAAELQRRYDLAQQREYDAKYGRAATQRKLAGEWRFTPLHSEPEVGVSVLVGYRVTYQGAIVGMLVVNGDRLSALGCGDEGSDSPTAVEVLTAYHLHVK